ncbi:uncharacterized protein LOC119673906 [Teleopsis dalmanni]|uniref:uncharacterized protein LOC119673906 n=1 Tax=Teleopsis dalmanni TaxID=139649 RepID=UPI0018CCE51C|nr:uncharacterized protein LOC119673906 [Teleopsis dalmanni]
MFRQTHLFNRLNKIRNLRSNNFSLTPPIKRRDFLHPVKAQRADVEYNFCKSSYIKQSATQSIVKDLAELGNRQMQTKDLRQQPIRWTEEKLAYRAKIKTGEIVEALHMQRDEKLGLVQSQQKNNMPSDNKVTSNKVGGSAIIYLPDGRDSRTTKDSKISAVAKEAFNEVVNESNNQENYLPYQQRMKNFENTKLMSAREFKELELMLSPKIITMTRF